jgi:hypothetical protein
MSRIVTLRNSPDCETDNPFFRVIPLFGRTFFFNDFFELKEAQIFPNKLFGIGYPLTDTVALNEAFRFFANADYFVSLTDQLELFDQQYVIKYLKTLTVALSDKVESTTDEFDAVKTQKTITIVLRDSTQLLD